jgi:hypothetical protein
VSAGAEVKDAEEALGSYSADADDGGALAGYARGVAR